MIIKLEHLFRNVEDSVTFEMDLDFSAQKVSGIEPFLDPVSFKGEVVNRSGTPMLRYRLSTVVSMPCDRCLQLCKTPINEIFSYTLVQSAHIDSQESVSLMNLSQPDTLVIEKNRLDLHQLGRSDLFLSLPHKWLCSDQCKGMCSSCGVNWNDTGCSCSQLEQSTMNPQFEILQKLLT